jgi:hypothetical protein
MIKETLILNILEKSIAIEHEGIKYFRNQESESRNSLEAYLLEEISKGKTEGYLPYNNFEASIRWSIDNSTRYTVIRPIWFYAALSNETVTKNQMLQFFTERAIEDFIKYSFIKEA